MSPAAPRPETSCVRMSFISVLLVLEGRGDETLLLDGHTGHATRADLAAVGDELAQERGVLVVDVLDLRRLERVGLLLGLAHYGLGHRGALRSVRARSFSLRDSVWFRWDSRLTCWCGWLHRHKEAVSPRSQGSPCRVCSLFPFLLEGRLVVGRAGAPAALATLTARATLLGPRRRAGRPRVVGGLAAPEPVATGAGATEAAGSAAPLGAVDL